MAGHTLDVSTIGLFDFDETDAPTYASFLDGSSGAVNLTAMPVTDPPRVIAGPLAEAGNYARHFNGTTHHAVSAVANTTLNTVLVGSTYTFICRVRPEDRSGLRRYLMVYGLTGDGDATTNITGAFFLGGTGLIGLLRESGTGTDEEEIQVDGDPVPNDAWATVAIVANGTSISFYWWDDEHVGGLQDTVTVALAVGGASSTSRVWIGQSSGNSSHYKGALRGMVLYPAVLDLAQLEAIVEREDWDADPTAHGGATFYYGGNETPDAIDKSPKGQHLRLFASGNSSVAAASVDTSANTFTLANHPYQSGDGPVQLTTSSALPSGLSAATDYWIIRRSASTIAFATSQANALLGTTVDITTQGTGTHTVSRAPFLSTAPSFRSSLCNDGGFARVMDGTKELDSFLGNPTTPDILAALKAACTVEAWVQPEYVTPEVIRGLLLFGDPESELAADNFFGVQLSAAYNLTGFWEHSTGTDDTYTATSGLDRTEGPLSDLVHIAMVKYEFSAGNWRIKFYMNAEYLGESGNLSNFSDATNGYLRLLVGPSEVGMRGAVDSVRLSSVARTSTEIAASYQAGLADVSNPVIDNFNVEPGSSISPTGSIDFDVTDDVALASIVLLAQFAGGEHEVIWNGDEFIGIYRSSTRTAIDGGYRFSIRRSPNWHKAPTIHYVIVDTSGKIGALA